MTIRPKDTDPALQAKKARLFMRYSPFVSPELVLMLMDLRIHFIPATHILDFQTSKLFSLDQEQGVPVFRTVSTKHRYFNPQAFVAKKPTEQSEFSVSGSTTFGRPSDDRTSYVNWFRKALLLGCTLIGDQCRRD